MSTQSSDGYKSKGQDFSFTASDGRNRKKLLNPEDAIIENPELYIIV